MYSKIFLLVLFTAIVVLGVLLNKRPTVPEGFQSFCSHYMPGSQQCPRLYGQLKDSNEFQALDDPSRFGMIQEYEKKFAELAKADANFAYKSEADQVLAIQQSIRDATPNTESARVSAELASTCPAEAYTAADGKIHVEPNGRVFQTSTEYANWLAAFYAQNTSCKPLPPVKPYTGPTGGVLGAGAAGDRTVMNKALQDLYDKWDSNVSERKPGEIPVRTFQFPAPGEQTYAKTPINSLDDYEFNRVFELESKPRMAQLSKEVKNNLLNAMQLDWPILPYSSETKAVLEEQFVDARMQDGFREPKSGVFFKNMEGVEIAPPDEEIAAAREAKILSAYQPTDITSHVVDDEYERVAKVVAQQYSTDPDWEPVVEKRGPHQYAVTELKPRRKVNKEGQEEVEWEGEAATTVAAAKQQGLLEGGDVKPNSMSIQDNLQDPFFAKTGVADHSNDRFWKYSDFSSWTPGLERMFAPTDPTNEWK